MTHGQMNWVMDSTAKPPETKGQTRKAKASHHGERKVTLCHLMRIMLNCQFCFHGCHVDYTGRDVSQQCLNPERLLGLLQPTRHSKTVSELMLWATLKSKNVNTET